MVNKRTLIIIIVGALLIIGAIIFFILYRQKPSTKTGQTEEAQIVNGALADLGTPSKEEQINIATDNNISADSIKNTKTRNGLIDKYGLAPELLLSTKNFVNNFPKLTGGEIYNNPQINFNFNLSSSASQAIQSDESKKIANQIVPIYEFETNIDNKFLSNLARSFSIEEKSKETDPATGDTIIANFNPSQSPQGNTELKTLMVNPLTGSFRYYATGQATNDNAEPIQRAQNFLLNNPVLSAYAKNLDFTQTTTYELKNAQGIKFVEFHRGWRPLPIINPMSIFNLQKLGRNILETISDPLNKNALVEDSNIVNTSDGLNGYLRPDDFNTITVGVSEQGVITISGQVRPLKNDAGQLKLISPAAAFENVKAGQYYQTTVVTAGEGIADPKKVYPNNIAESDGAVIDTIYLTYIEEPVDKKQSYLQPVYVMRGSARLKSGYNVSFSLITAAYEKSVKTSSLLEVSADVESENIKIDFVKIKVEETPQAGAQAAGETVSAADEAQATGASQYDNMSPKQIPESESCYKQFRDFRTIDGMILARTRSAFNNPDTGKRIFRFTPLATQSSISQSDKKNVAFAQQTGSQQVQPTVKKYLETLSVAEKQGFGSFFTSDRPSGGGCVTCNLGSTPCSGKYYSGTSPTIYLYGSDDDEFQIKPEATGEITYSDPPLFNQWTLTAIQNPKPYYYEFTYDDIQIPKEGFVISKESTSSFLQNFLLPRLNLNQNEIEDFMVDIETHILSQTPENKKYYKISLIDSAEIERVLPLEINPQPAGKIRNLLHFESLEKPELVLPPKLPNKINRSQFDSLFVENGCLLDENGKQN